MKIVIIGAGPAGEAAAKTIRSQNKEAEIALIEKEQAGGLCLNKGCIPSKTLLEQVHKYSQVGVALDWNKLQNFKTQVVSGIRSQLEMNLKRLKVDLVQGAAKFKSPNEITVKSATGETTLAFDKAILTAGTENIYPPAFDTLIADILDSDRVLDLTEAPKSIVIVGGGAIGLEFACLLNAAGTEVTIIELQKGILPGEDAAVVSALTRVYEGRGIQIKTETKVTEAKKTGATWTVKLSSGDEISTEQILVSVGRRPNLKAFSPEQAAIKTEKNQIVLNSYLQSSNENVFAAGDVTGQTRLAHAAAVMGDVAGANALGKKQTYDGSLVPRCLYSWPEVASVGQWKYELEEEGKPVKAARAFFKGSSKALAADQTDGFVQVVSDPGSGKIYGAQIMGGHATELIHIFSVAISKNMTTQELGNVMFAHPTLSESIKDACRK